MLCRCGMAPTACSNVLENKPLQALVLNLTFARLKLDVAGMALRALILKGPKFTWLV